MNEETAWCSKCQTHYPVSRFARDRTRASGYAYNCKDCIRNYQQQRKNQTRSQDKHTRNLEKYVRTLQQFIKEQGLEPPQAPWGS